MKYNPLIVKAWFMECGLPEPKFEVKFHPKRRWAFDICFPEYRLAVEVQGGIWVGGRHSRGKGMVNDMEKNNEAIRLGWRVLYMQPKDVMKTETIELIRKCL